MQVADLDAVAPGVAEVATEGRLQRQAVFVDEFLPDFIDLCFIPDHEAEMFRAIGLQGFHFKNGQKLMFAQFAPGGSLPSPQHFQIKHV